MKWCPVFISLRFCGAQIRKWMQNWFGCRVFKCWCLRQGPSGNRPWEKKLNANSFSRRRSQKSLVSCWESQTTTEWVNSILLLWTTGAHTHWCFTHHRHMPPEQWGSWGVSYTIIGWSDTCQYSCIFLELHTSHMQQRNPSGRETWVHWAVSSEGTQNGENRGTLKGIPSICYSWSSWYRVGLKAGLNLALGYVYS